MPNPLGTPERPLRVAIVGSGPSGFYAAESLLTGALIVKVDMLDRLPAPYGLVRYGVAPDHPKIKNVIKVYEKAASHERFSFIGNVHVGKDISVENLKKYYDAIIFACGAETDKKLGISGEDLPGSHTATEFVAWYNGHPDHRHKKFDLSSEIAVIIGQGNVSMDVGRILCKTVDELKETDIAQHALETLSESKIKTVYLIGRRGPVQAAFTPVEIREFGELKDCDPVVDPKDLELSPASQKELDDPQNNSRKKNFETLQKLSTLQRSKSRKIVIQFYKSPVEITGSGKVEKIILEKNELTGEADNQKAIGTGKKETLSCGLVFRSVGYSGKPVAGVPFDEKKGLIPNQKGRVMQDQQVLKGLYAVGWIKRGANGVIGTNKPDSEETVKSLLEDIGQLEPCSEPSTENVFNFLKSKGVRVVGFNDWKKIDTAEIERGKLVGKPREKFTSVEDMLKAIG